MLDAKLSVNPSYRPRRSFVSLHKQKMKTERCCYSGVYPGVKESGRYFTTVCVRRSQCFRRRVCVCVTVRNSSTTRITTKFSATKLFFPLVFKYEFMISSFASIFLYYDEIEKIWVNYITLFLNLVTRTLYLYLVRNKSYELWAFVNRNVHSYRKSIALLEFFFFIPIDKLFQRHARILPQFENHPCHA